jgi:hypothetical protein
LQELVHPDQLAKEYGGNAELPEKEWPPIFPKGKVRDEIIKDHMTEEELKEKLKSNSKIVPPSNLAQFTREQAKGKKRVGFPRKVMEDKEEKAVNGAVPKIEKVVEQKLEVDDTNNKPVSSEEAIVVEKVEEDALDDTQYIQKPIEEHTQRSIEEKQVNEENSNQPEKGKESIIEVDEKKVNNNSAEQVQKKEESSKTLKPKFVESSMRSNSNVSSRLKPRRNKNPDSDKVESCKRCVTTYVSLIHESINIKA